jgi:hypothetical protein
MVILHRDLRGSKLEVSKRSVAWSTASASTSGVTSIGTLGEIEED